MHLWYYLKRTSINSDKSHGLAQRQQSKHLTIVSINRSIEQCFTSPPTQYR